MTELVLGFFLLAFSGIIGWQVSDLRVFRNGVLDSAGLPYLIAICIFLSSIYFVVRGSKALLGRSASTKSDERNIGSLFIRGKNGWSVFIIVSIYVLAMSFGAPYTFSTFLFLMANILLLGGGGRNNVVITTVISVFFSLVIRNVFVLIFNIDLPYY